MATRKTPAARTRRTPAAKSARAVKPATATMAAPAEEAKPEAAPTAKPKAAKTAKSLKSPKPAPKPPKKAPKVRPRLVRDSFTMPEADFAHIATLKARALHGQRETKKSELLRAGLRALAAMDQGALLAALGELEPVKTGRPKKAH